MNTHFIVWLTLLSSTVYVAEAGRITTPTGQTQRDTKVAQLGGYPPTNCEFVRVGKGLLNQPIEADGIVHKPFLGLYLKQRHVILGTEQVQGMPSDTATVTGGWDVSDRNYTNFTAVLNTTDNTINQVPSTVTNTDGRPYFKQWNSRSPHYIYHLLGRWYVGPVLDQPCSGSSGCLSAPDASAWPEVHT